MTCLNPINWSISGDNKTVCIVVTIWLFIYPSTAVQSQKRDWFSGNSWLQPLVIGRSPSLGVIAGVVWWYELVAFLHQTVFCGYGEHKLSVPASSKAWYHRCRISTYKPMNVEKIFSRNLSVNLGQYRHQKVQEDSLDAIFCHCHVVLLFLWAQRRVRPMRQLVNSVEVLPRIDRFRKAWWY